MAIGLGGKAISLGLAVLLAGCLQASKQSDPLGPGFPTDLPLPEPYLPLLQYQDCTRVLIPLDGVPALVDAVVPDAFEPWGNLPPGTAALLVTAMDCERVVDNESILGPARHYWAVAFADPRNESWHTSGVIDYYVLDYATTAPGLVESLGRQGIEIQTAQIAIEKQPLLEGVQSWGWQVEAAGWSATFHHRLRSEAPQTGTIPARFWFGDGPFRRIDANMTVTVDALLNAGEIVLDGNSRLEQAWGVPAGAWQGGTYVNVTYVMTVDPTVFRE